MIQPPYQVDQALVNLPLILFLINQPRCNLDLYDGDLPLAHFSPCLLYYQDHVDPQAPLVPLAHLAQWNALPSLWDWAITSHLPVFPLPSTTSSTTDRTATTLKPAISPARFLVCTSSSSTASCTARMPASICCGTESWCFTPSPPGRAATPPPAGARTCGSNVGIECGSSQITGATVWPETASSQATCCLQSRRLKSEKCCYFYSFANDPILFFYT